VAIWHAVEGDWQPPLSGPRDRFESTGTRVFRAANGSLSALPQGVSAGRDNWRLEAPEEVARPAFFLVRRLPEDANRGRRDDVADTLEKLCVRAHEGALLQLRESDVLGRVRRIQSELEREFPRTPAENGVTVEPHLQRVDPRDAFARDVRSKLTSPHRLVESGQGLGPPEVGARSSCSAETFARASARWSVAPLSMTKRATPTQSLGAPSRG